MKVSLDAIAVGTLPAHIVPGQVRLLREFEKFAA